MTGQKYKNSTKDLEILISGLDTASLEEIKKNLGSMTTNDSNDIVKKIVELGMDDSYLWMLCEVSKKLKTSYKVNYSGDIRIIDSQESPSCMHSTRFQVLKLEESILEYVFSKAYENLSITQKDEFNKKALEIATVNGKNITGIGGAAAAMILAEIGGFATFTLLSSVLGTISLGLLPFGAYTAASSVLGTVLGPVGWIGLGLFALAKLGEPDLKKIIPAVVSIAIIRSKKNGSINTKNHRTIKHQAIIGQDNFPSKNYNMEKYEAIAKDMSKTKSSKENIVSILIFSGCKENDAKTMANKYFKDNDAT